MMKRLLIYLMLLAFALPNAIAGEKTVTISRNEGIYDDGTGVYYCTKGGITMTFSSGLNNVNYLVEHQQVVFDIFSTNYVIKKIKFNCLDNTTNDNLDCFYWGPSTIHEFTGAPYTPTGTYTYSGYIGTWVGGSTPSKYIKFVTEGKPVRFGSVEITYDKEFGDIYEKVTDNSEIENGQTYALVSQYASKALGKEDYYSTTENLTTFTSTPVTLLDNNNKVKVTDEVQLIKLESSGYSSRPWYIKVGDNYMRRRSSLSGSSSGAANGQGYNLLTASSVTSYEEYFRVSISVSGNTNQNALIRFDHNTSETAGGKTFAIRHYNGGSLFRDMDYSNNNQYAANQRVYLYKPAQSYEVTTECIPSNGGYITLENGILTDDQGRNWSQHFDNVTFFVGSANGYGIGEVTITDLNTRAVNVLAPTATSDFGNNYRFEMPANDVKVTANFLQPYNIDTICNPTDGGIFNFISGYTDFNGQHKSNEGKTVTFKPIAADGYIFQSVTYTNNGTTTTLTPDADGVFSFVMPGNDVTLTANFEEAHDLYLLGTANGKSGWAPYGPKFTFDGENQVYYIDVYFKGYNDDPYTDPAYGYFSLTKKIDEGGNWDNIAGYRLAAENNQTWVADGYTGVHLYGDRPNNSFKIKPGVYRIEVNKEMTEMSITEYPLELTFDPAGGVPGNGTIVEPNTEVTIGSNLQDLVHAINPNEDPVSFYNSIDNWGTQENDNTRVISNIGETTIVASAALGQYLIVNGSATYEIPSDLYLLGTANGRTNWVPYGPKFTFDETNQEYYIDVYFKGGNDDANVDQAFGYFSLSTRIGSNDNDWGSINGYRIYATSHNYEVADGNTYTDCFQTNYDNAFKIPAGVYRIKVNRTKTQMTIIEYPLTLTFDPVSGSTVAAGDQVTISSNLDELVHGINPNEVNASFKNSTDGGTTWDPDNTAAITAVGATTTVKAEANIGYIVVPGTATYTIPAPTVYNITTQVNPEGSNAGTITAPSGSEAGQTVTFTVADADPAVFTLTGVEVVDSNNGIVESFEPSADGSYTFTMPSDDVTIYADYVRTPYNVTTSWSPSEGGSIWLNNVNTPQTISVANGEQVVFGIAPADGYRLISLTVMNETTGQEITPTSSGSNEYTFTMPTGNVTITAQFDNQYNIYTQSVPEGVGTFTFHYYVNQKAAPGQQVAFSVSSSLGYRLDKVTMSYEDENNETITTTLTLNEGEYDFTMPAADVTITAEFIKTYRIFRECIPEEGGSINSLPNYAAAGSSQNFYVSTNSGYRLSEVTATYVDENDETQTITLTKDGNRFRFTMPAAEVTVIANFVPTYAITTQCTPPEGGSISLIKTNAPENDEVTFTVTSNVGYALTDVTISYVDENGVNQTITLTPGENGVYSFIMPAAPVTINANFAHIPYGISTVCIPPEGGTIDVASSAFTGDLVDVTVVKAPGYLVGTVTVTNDVTGQVTQLNPGQDGKYHFTMPDAPVTITANFNPVGDLYLLGTENGKTVWAPNGPQFNYDPANDVYTLTVYYKGIRDVAGMEDDHYGHFNLTTVVHESDFDYIEPYRLVPNNAVQNVNYGFAYPLSSTDDTHPGTNEFMIPAGVYTLTVPGDKSTITATRIPISVTLDPPADIFNFPGCVYYGFEVTASSNLDEIVHAINPNEDNATFMMRTQAYFASSEGSYFDETVPGNQTKITHEGTNLVTADPYIGWIVPHKGENYRYRPLRYLEQMHPEQSATYNVVCDTLVGVWAAGPILWAKDLGNRAFAKDINTAGAIDYGIEIAHMQDAERGWDQSNWIMLDFTNYLEDNGIIGDDAALDVLNQYVNKQIKPLSVHGLYVDDFSYRIELDEAPVALKDTIGYPGYLQDPLEKLAHPEDGSAPVTYHYNHYTPCNFMGKAYLVPGTADESVLYPPYVEGDDEAAWEALVTWVMQNEYFAELFDYDWNDPDSWTNDQWNNLDNLLIEWEHKNSMFFVRAKVCEVAHVWGVWRGDDVFDVYEKVDPETGKEYNKYELVGAFHVQGWEYNRLTPSPAYYGKPEGENALQENVAYEFHIAILVPEAGHVEKKMPSRAPVAMGNDPAMMDGDYLYYVYPLDLEGQDSVTDIPELTNSINGKTVQSVRYYNIMGQEGSEPFSGVNIVVTRYTDGSISTAKVLR